MVRRFATMFGNIVSSEHHSGYSNQGVTRYKVVYPPPPLALTRACPNTETPCFRTFGPFFEPLFLRS